MTIPERKYMHNFQSIEFDHILKPPLPKHLNLKFSEICSSLGDQLWDALMDIVDNECVQESFTSNRDI